MDNPNITIEEYIRLEEEKARRRSEVYNWETATYDKIWDNEGIHDLGSIETEFPAIVFNDTLISKIALSCEPTVSSINNDEIEFRISFDESDDEDCMIIFDKNSFSYQIISVNNLKTGSENDNDKVNMLLLPSLKPTDNDDDNFDIEHSSRDLSVKPLPDLINTDVGAYARGSNKLSETNSKRHAFWSLNEDILKITILKTNTPYPSRRYSISVHTLRNKDQYTVSRETQYAVFKIWNQYNILEDIRRGPYSKKSLIVISNPLDMPYSIDF
ncbi:hypothetical protein Tco_1263557 [Tanacetum coccineum]